MAEKNIPYKNAKELAEAHNKETLAIKLNERINAIQEKAKKGENINYEELKISNFPRLINRYENLSVAENMETETPPPQFSLKQLRHTYAEKASPSPTRKKAKFDNFYDPEMPSDEWLQGFLESLPDNLAVKPTVESLKGFWPRVIENVSTPISSPELSNPPQGKLSPSTQPSPSANCSNSIPSPKDKPNQTLFKSPASSLSSKTTNLPVKTVRTRSDRSKSPACRTNQ